SKRGWTSTGTHTNFFQTKSESQTRNKFSFVLSNKTNDSAFVSAAHEVTSRSNPGLSLGKGLTVGGDGRTAEADRFVASITTNRDTREWELSTGKSDVSARHGDPMEGEASHVATLPAGERRIVINPVFSEKLDKRPSFGSQPRMSAPPPAMGYEFVEDGHS